MLQFFLSHFNTIIIKYYFKVVTTPIKYIAQSTLAVQCVEFSVMYGFYTYRLKKFFISSCQLLDLYLYLQAVD